MFILLPGTSQSLPTQQDGEDWLSGLTMKNMNHNMEIDLETPQIGYANIITMENATCSGVCC